MKIRESLNRRAFLQLIGSTTALGAVGVSAPWLEAATTPDSRLNSGFAYVGGGEGADEGIRVFSVRSGRWTQIQFVSSRNPACLVLHPTEQFLYAVNQIDLHENLPTGTVEAYRISKTDGRLTLQNRAPLSLAATMPNHATVSNDGQSLIVTTHGGIYNVLPIAGDGSLGRVRSIVKSTGAGPNEQFQTASHPQYATFDADGKYVLATDLGNDSLNIFTLTDGRLNKAAHYAALPGSGPRHMAVHPDGRFIFVSNSLEGSISSHRFNRETGEISDRASSIKLPKSTGALALHPSGRFLYAAADGVAAFSIDNNGSLTSIDFQNLAADRVILSGNGSVLYALNHKEGKIVAWNINFHDGQLRQPILLAESPAPKNLVFRAL